jgi:hypothetical protein
MIDTTIRITVTNTTNHNPKAIHTSIVPTVPTLAFTTDVMDDSRSVAAVAAEVCCQRADVNAKRTASPVEADIDKRSATLGKAFTSISDPVPGSCSKCQSGKSPKRTRDIRANAVLARLGCEYSSHIMSTKVRLTYTKPGKITSSFNLSAICKIPNGSTDRREAIRVAALVRQIQASPSSVAHSPKYPTRTRRWLLLTDSNVGPVIFAHAPNESSGGLSDVR